jgi:hypothetical protein
MAPPASEAKFSLTVPAEVTHAIADTANRARQLHCRSGDWTRFSNRSLFVVKPEVIRLLPHRHLGMAMNTTVAGVDIVTAFS